MEAEQARFGEIVDHTLLPVLSIFGAVLLLQKSNPMQHRNLQRICATLSL